MPELTDDQLDGLFRKSAEEFDPPFDPAAWRDMKTRLDANDRNPAGGSLIWKNLLRWGLPIGLLLLLSGGAWYAFHWEPPVVRVTRLRSMPTAGVPQSQNKERIQADITISTPDHKPARTTPVDPEEFDDHVAKQPTDHPVASVAESARSGQRLNKSVTHSESNVSPDPEAATKHPTFAYGSETRRNRGLNRSALRATASDRKGVSEMTSYGSRNTGLRRGERTRNRRNLPEGQYGTAFTEISRTPGRASVRRQRKVASQPLILSNTVDESGSTARSVTDKIGPVIVPTLTNLASRPATWPKLTAALNRPVMVQSDTPAHRVVSQLASQRGLSIRVALAPDLSTVGLKNFSRPGTNIGLLLDYRLASRWSVQAGVLQSSKVYRALPTDYDPPAGAWKGGGKPENIDGQCTMLDIPVNVRYDVILKPQASNQLASRWFVSGGVTSYIMEREDYDYNFAAHTYPYPKAYGADTTTGGYRFSNLNLSIGYERAFSRRLSWQVEPFVKVPLKGIGLFNINLLSTGVFFSVRYKLTK